MRIMLTLLRNNMRPFHSHLTTFTIFSLILTSLSGVLVSAFPIGKACSAWTLCFATTLTPPLSSWIHPIHQMSVLFTAIILSVMLVVTWHSHRNDTRAMVYSTAIFTLFLSQLMLGARVAMSHTPALIILHRMTVLAIWGCMVLFATQGASLRQQPLPEPVPQMQPRRLGRLLLDFFMLTKPVVVALLLVTTYAGMVIGGRHLPPWDKTLFTLLGGFLAAGGSSAINQYIDLQDDLKMQRTKKRPLPSGRLMPGEGLAFGVSLCIISFYLMATLVNLLAAGLALCGILYYVVLYSLVLKKATTLNIVIGGGAGALPPLVGWAAATGTLHIPALFLFAIVFMWTPPHFWALALVRKNDYARAGVPMLPVVRGEAHTRMQILIYTLELVLFTLLMPILGLGGAVYFIGALALGSFLLWNAYRLWKQAGKKVAWKMYRFSSMYLAFLFFVLMIDRLL